MKKSKLPPIISLEYLINEVKKQEQKEALKKKELDVLEV